MKVRFFLKDKKAKNPTAVYAVIGIDGERFKLYSGESIHPKYWNQKTNSARTTPQFPESPEFNQRLSNIRSTVNKTYLNYKNENDHKEPSTALFKAAIESALNKGKAKTDFLTFFKDFAIRTSTGSRINPRTKQGLKGTGGRSYTTTINHLKEFANQWSKRLDFDTVTLEFYEDFVSYLKASPRLLSQNTIGGHIKRVKAVMNEAVDRKLTSNLDFRSKRFVKLSEDSDSIYLTIEELKELAKLDLSERPTYDNVRDLFLIGCYTGLRFSDFTILTKENIKDGLIYITQTKTGDPIVIPVHKEVSRIMKKHGGQLPKAISNVKMNEYLKNICSEIEALKAEVTKEITKGGVRVKRIIPKWEMVSTHTARRSFATNEYKAGTPTLTIMAVTGHKTEKAFLKYIKVTPQEHALKLKEIWAKRDSKLKAV